MEFFGSCSLPSFAVIRAIRGLEKGSGTNSAEHPLGHLAIGS